jgi:hypothetical protein
MIVNDKLKLAWMGRDIIVVFAWMRNLVEIGNSISK